MTKKQRVAEIIEILKAEYPMADCSLEYTDPFKLLVAVRLAAQCTDARVNLVTPALFDRYPTCYELAIADIADVEEYVKTCGLYRSKAKDLVGMASRLASHFDGQVPDNMDDLLSLPGVGRKSANLILGDIYGLPAIVADTHCIRLSNRFGLVDIKDPKKVEFALLKIVPPEESNDFCHRLVLHGRAVCDARKPQCAQCSISHLCKSFN